MIVSGHRIDFTDRVTIGRNVIIGGPQLVAVDPQPPADGAHRDRRLLLPRVGGPPRPRRAPARALDPRPGLRAGRRHRHPGLPGGRSAGRASFALSPRKTTCSSTARPARTPPTTSTPDEARVRRPLSAVRRAGRPWRWRRRPQDDDLIAGGHAALRVRPRLPGGRGVPRLLPEEAGQDALSRRTQALFGDEWQRFPELLRVHADIFRWYFEGDGRVAWTALRVLDAGCGMGRWLHFARESGAAHRRHGRQRRRRRGGAAARARARTSSRPICASSAVRAGILRPRLQPRRRPSPRRSGGARCGSWPRSSGPAGRCGSTSTAPWPTRACRAAPCSGWSAACARSPPASRPTRCTRSRGWWPRSPPRPSSSPRRALRRSAWATA